MKIKAFINKKNIQIQLSRKVKNISWTIIFLIININSFYK